MQHFSHRIDTEEGLVTFYFNEESDSLYFVSVVDHSRKSHIFNMFKEGLKWSLHQKEGCCPEWIVRLESILGEKIKTHRKVGSPLSYFAQN